MATAIFLLDQARQNGGRRPSVLILEGARKPGAKILVSGGGRCNVTNREVHASDYQGGNPTIIRNILRALPVADTLAWMAGMGVKLKLEETGKWFPVTDKARTVLDALLNRLEILGAQWLTGVRAEELQPHDDMWTITCSDGARRSAQCVVMATGGMALPKSGSDGWGIRELRRLGHSIVEPVPALVPVTAESLGPSQTLQDMTGITTHLRVSYDDGPNGFRGSFVGSTLFTHFGLSGPAPMNISRWISRSASACRLDSGRLQLGLSDFEQPAVADRWLLDRSSSSPSRTVAALLQEHLPERLAQWWAGKYSSQRLGALNRADRTALAARIAGLPLKATGTRGFSFAETTAGGVALEEISHRTMESRIHPGLYLVGEILDADGRIGGFNFQWAWCTGRIAGRDLARRFSCAKS